MQNSFIKYNFNFLNQYLKLVYVVARETVDSKNFKKMLLLRYFYVIHVCDIFFNWLLQINLSPLGIYFYFWDQTPNKYKLNKERFLCFKFQEIQSKVAHSKEGTLLPEVTEQYSWLVHNTPEAKQRDYLVDGMG